MVVRETPYGRDLFLPRTDLESYAGKAGPAAGLLAYEALRVEHHRPRLGFETDHRTIPHELGWIDSAVHLQKGCYRGQETVARVQNLGKPRVGSSSCTWTAARSICRRTAPNCASRTTAPTAGRSASSPPPYATTSSARSRSAW